jgi:hypothetical protein
MLEKKPLLAKLPKEHSWKVTFSTTENYLQLFQFPWKNATRGIQAYSSQISIGHYWQYAVKDSNPTL